MSENQPTNVQLETNGNGTVSFATDVIATIAGLAATEVEGVNSMYAASSSLADIFSRRGSTSTKGLTKGVKVDISDNTLTIAVTIIVDYGFPVPDIAKSIQENVKKAVENMSGLTVTGVNVHVQGVSFEREMKAAAEIEEKQRLLLKKQAEEEPQREAAAEQHVEQPAPQQSVEDTPAETPEEEDDEFVLELEDDEPETPETPAEEPVLEPAVQEEQPAEGAPEE